MSRHALRPASPATASGPPTPPRQQLLMLASCRLRGTVYVVAHRFRGLLIRSRVARGLFWNTLTASEQEIRLGRWPLEPVLVAREMTAAVRFQKVSLPLWWGTDVMFETSGLGKRYVFVPFRPQQLRDCLQSLGWRLVEADDVNLQQLVRRLRP